MHFYFGSLNMLKLNQWIKNCLHFLKHLWRIIALRIIYRSIWSSSWRLHLHTLSLTLLSKLQLHWLNEPICILPFVQWLLIIQLHIECKSKWHIHFLSRTSKLNIVIPSLQNPFFNQNRVCDWFLWKRSNDMQCGWYF